jgi:hypothetical protein
MFEDLLVTCDDTNDDPKEMYIQEEASRKLLHQRTPSKLEEENPQLQLLKNNKNSNKASVM